MQRFLPGTSFPNLLIYGTAWKAEETRELVLKAFRSGYRSFDTAAQPKHYREDLVGEASRQILAEGAIERRDLFVGFLGFASLLPFRYCLPLNDSIAVLCSCKPSSVHPPDKIRPISRMTLHLL